MHLRGGRYETIGKIAAGGMAKVLLGRTVGVGGFERLVAIKAMHEHLSSDPDFVAMFLDEARLAARIHHPNVVSTLDVDEDEEGIFIVMEYIEGPALNAVQRAMRLGGQRVPVDVSLRIFLDTLAGLHAAHELKDAGGQPLLLVHRDVSPHNVLVGVDGIARLTDFGVARAESRISSTRAGQIKGKVAFMAPEQLDHLPVDRRADVYSAGVVLWELCTGQRMMNGENEGALVADVLHGTRRSPREIDPGISPELEAACMRALQPRAADRFPTAAAFAEAIEDADVPIASARGVAAFVAKLDIHQRPPTSMPPSSPSSGPNSRGSRSGVSSGEGSRPGYGSAPRAIDRSGSGTAHSSAYPPPSSGRDAPLLPSTHPTAASARINTPSRSRAALTAGVSVTILLAAGLVMALRSSARAPASAAAGAAPVPAPSATIAPSAAVISSAPAASVARADPTPSAPSAGVASSEPSHAVKVAEPPKPSGADGSAPAAVAPRPLSSSKLPGKAPPSSTSFRPVDL